MSAVLVILIIWFVLSLPVALLIGRFIALGKAASESRRQVAPTSTAVALPAHNGEKVSAYSM